MSNFNGERCDHCGKLVETRVDQPGWIHATEDTPSSRNLIRFIVSTPNASVSSIDAQNRQHSGTDWCGIACLTAALAGEGKKSPT